VNETERRTKQTIKLKHQWIPLLLKTQTIPQRKFVVLGSNLTRIHKPMPQQSSMGIATSPTQATTTLAAIITH